MSEDAAQVAGKDVNEKEKQPKQRLNSYSAAASKPAATNTTTTTTTTTAASGNNSAAAGSASNNSKTNVSRHGSRKSTSGDNNKKHRDRVGSTTSNDRKPTGNNSNNENRKGSGISIERRKSGTGTEQPKGSGITIERKRSEAVAAADRKGSFASDHHNKKNSNAGGGNRSRNNSYKNGAPQKQRSFDKNHQNNDKRRAMSTTAKSTDGGDPASEDKDDKKQRYRSTNSSNHGRSRNRTSNSATSNGESFDYDDYDLDEPFSDSDEESPYHREVQKPSLQIPRGRIRTLSGTVPPVGFSPKWGGPTMCLKCLNFFDLPDEIPKFSDHLLAEHQIVIEELSLIVDPKRYIEYWRNKKDEIETVFPKIVPDEKNEFHGKCEYYYEMSERIPEDYSCRQRLAMRRLEEALACQQREREDISFSMQCVFCRYVARGNRAKLIHHLYMIHHLNLGSPDNLVFVNEYLDYLRDQLQRNECIYCEKVFADRNVLMDHMRKRNHREVNPKNRWLDRFYVINYLEVGKRWLDVLAEDFEDKDLPAFQDSDEEEEDLDWQEWQEDNTDEDQLRIICLFCDDSHDKVQGLLHHLNEAHRFDLIGYIEKEKLDVYGRMKLLNHLRKEIFNTPNYRAKVQKADGIVEIPARETWDTEENLVPMFANDHLLWMLESYLDEQRPELAGHEVNVGSDVPAADRLIAESKANTIENVIPEDMPPLHDEDENEEFRELVQAVRSTSLD